MNLRKSVAAVAVGMLAPAIVSAHPGHAPTDFTAQVLQPFAGADHFLAFAALSGCLLGLLAIAAKVRSVKTQIGRK